MTSKHYNFILTVASIIPIVIIAVLIIAIEPSVLLTYRIAIGLMLITFSTISLVFLCLFKRDKHERPDIKNSALKRKITFFSIIVGLSFISTMLSATLSVTGLFRGHLLILISSVSLLIGGAIVLNNLKKQTVIEPIPQYVMKFFSPFMKAKKNCLIFDYYNCSITFYQVTY